MPVKRAKKAKKAPARKVGRKAVKRKTAPKRASAKPAAPRVKQSKGQVYDVDRYSAGKIISTLGIR